jgi:hypothetical protein
MAVKNFITLGSNVIKLVCPKFTNFRHKLVFVTGRPFQPSLMFVGKAGAYPIEETAPL